MGLYAAASPLPASRSRSPAAVSPAAAASPAASPGGDAEPEKRRSSMFGSLRRHSSRTRSASPRTPQVTTPRGKPAAATPRGEKPPIATPRGAEARGASASPGPHLRHSASDQMSQASMPSYEGLPPRPYNTVIDGSPPEASPMEENKGKKGWKKVKEKMAKAAKLGKKSPHTPGPSLS